MNKPPSFKNAAKCKNMKKYKVHFLATENVLIEARSAFYAASKVFRAYMRDKCWRDREKPRVKIEPDLEEDGKTPIENVWKGNVSYGPEVGKQSWTYLYVCPA
jgi:hypothetical protein